MRLRELRKQKNITMKKLGEIVGVSESAISQYETGKRSADYETMLKFAELFDCSLDYLLGRTDDPTPTKKDTPADVSDDDIKFALWGNPEDEITDEMFEEVKEFARFVADRKKKRENEK